MFEGADWTCSEAANGQEAIDEAQSFAPDIIVLDLSMPVMNGLTAGRILTQLLPQTPLILFTSVGGVLRSEDLQRAGFSALISKASADDLLTTAQTLLRRP
jgi:CheY-like chemotaxis protein